MISKIAKGVAEAFPPLLDLIYPPICPGCKGALLKSEPIICINCRLSLPFLEKSEAEHNLERKFRGKIELNQNFGLLEYRKRNNVQNLLYAIKYQDNPKLAVDLGLMMANHYLQMDYKGLPDLIIPVPLHKKKQKKRGYNQAERLAFGFSKKSSIQLADSILKRSSHQSTLTALGRLSRAEILNSYSLDDPSELRNKNHIMIIDDVITTGTTIEACYYPLRKIFDGKISVACLAVAQ